MMHQLNNEFYCGKTEGEEEEDEDGEEEDFDEEEDDEEDEEEVEGEEDDEVSGEDEVKVGDISTPWICTCVRFPITFENLLQKEEDFGQDGEVDEDDEDEDEEDDGMYSLSDFWMLTYSHTWALYVILLVPGVGQMGRAAGQQLFALHIRFFYVVFSRPVFLTVVG